MAKNPPPPLDDEDDADGFPLILLVTDCCSGERPRAGVDAVLAVMIGVERTVVSCCCFCFSAVEDDATAPTADEEDDSTINVEEEEVEYEGVIVVNSN
jgi:hypothetical protein